MKRNKSQKGITLVALIITIIVLLILAVVAIRAVTGDGILQYATSAKDETQLAQAKEEAVLAANEWIIYKNLPGNNKQTFAEFMVSKLTTGGDSIFASVTATEEGKVLITTKDNKQFEITETGVIELVGGAGETPGGNEGGSGEVEEEFDGVVISDATYFSYDENAINGLSEKGVEELEKLAGQDVKIVVPGSYEDIQITEIMGNAFYQNSEFNNLNSLSIEMPSIITIGHNAFEDCTTLKHVSIPNVETISQQALAYNTALVSIDMPKVTSVGLQAFCGCSELKSIELPNITSLDGQGAFSNCTKLTTIKLPNVEILGDGIFADCTSLTSVELPNLINLGDNSFNWCENLISVKLPNVEEIGNYAFITCTSLKSVKMPKVKKIGDTAFEGCASLEKIEVSHSYESVAGNAFNSTPKLNDIYIPGVEEQAECEWYNILGEEITIHWNTPMPE